MPNKDKETAVDAILRKLNGAQMPVAIHELGIYGHSQTSLSARLREMEGDRVVKSQFRPGHPFKEWWIVGKVFKETQWDQISFHYDYRGAYSERLRLKTAEPTWVTRITHSHSQFIIEKRVADGLPVSA